MNLVIFDIDGVIADSSHRQHLIPDDYGVTENWGEWNKHAMLDSVISPMCNLARTLLLRSSLQVLFLTARCESGKNETMHWLRNAIHPAINCSSVIMREDGDSRPAYEIKAEKCLNIRESGDEIVTIFEDDPQNVAVLQSLNFPAVLLVPPLTDTSHLPQIDLGLTRQPYQLQQ